MSPRLPLSMLVALAMGCAAAPTPASQPPQPTQPTQPPQPTQPTAPPMPTPTEPATPAPAPATPPTAEVPAAAPVAPTAPPTTCVITQEWWMPDRAQQLRTPSGRVYAAITQAEHVKLSTAGGARLELTSHGLRLRTTPKPGDLPLYTRGLVFDGVLQAGGATPLRWTAIDGPRLRVTPPSDPRVRFARSPGLAVACADLELVPESTELPVPDHALRARGPITVAASPGGPAVLTLQLKRSVDVKLIARNGPHAHIAWPISDLALTNATVTGWVAGDLVDGPPILRDVSGEFGASGMSATSDWGGCSAEHPLLADAGRGPEPVGEILVGTRIKKGPRRGALVAVEIVGQSVQMVPPAMKARAGAQFLLAPNDATDCAR